MWRGWAASPLLLLAFIGTVQAEPGEGWSVEDASDDQSWRPLLQHQGTPPDVDAPSGWAKHLDLRQVQVGQEDETGFAITLKMEKLTVGPRRVSQFNCYGNQGAESIQVWFRLARDDESTQYRVDVQLLGEWSSVGPSEFIAAGATGCLCMTSSQYGCRSQRIDASLDAATNSIRIWVFKASLMGLMPMPLGYDGYSHSSTKWPQDLKVGEVLDQFRVVTVSRPPNVPLFNSNVGGLLMSVRDEASGDQPFRFQAPPANSVLRLRVEDAVDRLPVRMDGNQTLSFHVHNAGDGKRIVLFSYSLDGPDDLRAHYEVTGPSRATLPAGEARRFFLSLKVGPEARPTDNVTLSVRATSAGYPGEVGAGQAILVPGPHIGPGSNVLYLDTRTSEYWECGLLATLNAQTCPRGFLTPRKDDPLRIPGDWTPHFQPWGSFGPALRSSNYARTAGQGTPLPVAFDATGTAHAEVVFESDYDLGEMEITVFLSHGNRSTGDRLPHKLFESTRTVTVGTGETKVAIDARIRSLAGPLPRGTHFELGIQLEGTQSPGSLLQTGTPHFKILKHRTFVALPVVELPPALRNEVVESAFQLSAQSVEEFVNPAKSRLYNLTLLNQGGQRYRASFAVQGPEGWQAKVLPGHAFDLEPGDSLRLGLLITAPAAASEGEIATFVVNVTDPNGNVIAIKFRAVVATQVDLPDDAGRYRVDEEASRAAVKEVPQKTPGVSWLALLAGLAVAFVVASRSRRC